MRCVAYGEDAAYVDLEIDAAPDRAARTHAAAAALRRRFPDADVAVGAGAIAVHGAGPTYELREAARLASAGEAPAVPRPLRRVEVVYDGPDLEDVARSLGLDPAALCELHAGRDYVVEIAGFLPGFAYMGPLDPRLVSARRASPRPLVAACSVGIAGGFTGIYPFASPGGWNLIGRAVGVVPFDPARAEPSLFLPGDRVRFLRSDAPPTGAVAAAVDASVPAGAPAVRILAAPPAATIQDAGRGGQLARGIPPSGPLDPETHAAANAAVGNPPGAASIEVPLGRIELSADGEVRVSIDGSPAVRLADGERLEVAESSSAVRYLAFEGGIDVPVVLGARATLLVARLGGIEGRTLRAGDRLPIGAGSPAPSGAVVSDAAPAVDMEAMAPLVVDLVVDPGPHLARFPSGAFEALLAGSFHVSRLGDRVGVRLEGDRVPREGADVALPVPMRRGAVQVSTDGTPIVLGPDHPVTGGYPVIAVVRRASQAVLARLRPGRAVRFVSA